MTVSVTHARVLDLIERWGADSNLWPDTERAAARALIKSDPAAFDAALTAARALDADLAALDVPRLGDALEARLIASAPAASRRERQAHNVRGLWAWVPGGALAALAVGFGASLGMAAAAQSADDPADTAAAVFALDDTYEFSEAVQ